MGADKNSSPKRDLGLYPKFTTKDSHTSLPRSRSHTGPTNPRNKPQMILKRKHNSRSKGLSCPVKALEDGPRGRFGRSARTGRTVRDPRADGPVNTTEPPTAHPETWTARTLHADCPRATRAARTVRGLRADGPPNPSRPKPAGQTDQNEDAQEHAMNTKNPRPTSSMRTVRAYQAECPPGANRRGSSRPRAKTRARYHLSFHGSPKRLKLLRNGLGKM
jgi:hypothetical protein